MAALPDWVNVILMILTIVVCGYLFFKIKDEKESDKRIEREGKDLAENLDFQLWMIEGLQKEWSRENEIQVTNDYLTMYLQFKQASDENLF